MKNIPLVFYHYMQERLWDNSNHGIIDRKRATSLVVQLSNISKKLSPLIIKELEVLKLIEVGRYEIKVVRPTDTDSFLKKVYSELEIF